MPIRVFVMLRRKPGLTPEQFRDGYENGHSRLGMRLFGHLWTEYRRNYVGSAANFARNGGGRPDPSIDGGDFGYDAITEIVFPDISALDEMARIAAAHADEIVEDEERHFDRPNCYMVAVETVQEDLSAHQPIHA